jgi:hypothetical protein
MINLIRRLATITRDVTVTFGVYDEQIEREEDYNVDIVDTRIKENDVT